MQMSTLEGYKVTNMYKVKVEFFLMPLYFYHASSTSRANHKILKIP